ncbi:MAG: hypothetical protein ABFC96_12420 [Thermoguttaceae bacterium]
MVLDLTTLDLTNATPFLTWLFGPGWTDGAVFQPIPLVVLLLLACGGAWRFLAAVRKGCGGTTRRAGLILTLLVTGAVLLALAAGGVWFLLPAATRTGLQPAIINGLGWLMGPGWYHGAMYQWLLVVVCATVVVWGFGWLFTAARRGPVEAFMIAGQVAGDAVLDTLRLSPRRVAALAYLAVKESIRRQVMVVLLVFILIVLFAGWYLGKDSIDPARAYLDCVLTATSYLVLLLAMFLSALSLPADLKSRTLHTIVTKPVRASEVVLGRMVGFMAIVTMLLVPMAAMSYVFVQRGVSHTHELAAETLKPAEGNRAGQPTELQGLTSKVNGHRHKVTIDLTAEQGKRPRGKVETEQRHTHAVIVQKDGDKFTYKLGPDDGMLVARVPVYGKLAFHDRTGQPTDKGINVGDEWTYRSFIEGGSLATAIWSFRGIDEQHFPKGLPIELTLEAFRTYKGDIEKPVVGSLWVRNPSDDRNKPVMVETFYSKDFVTDVHQVPRHWKPAEGKNVDLFKDLVTEDGRVEVWLRCDDKSQYFGVSQADMYLRSTNAAFGWNFVKGYISIWLTSMLVVSLGVMFSTFLSGPIALMASFGALLAGFCHEFMFKLATGQTLGGGPFESITRIWTQANVTSEAEPGLVTTVEQTLDAVAKFGLYLLSAVLPDFSHLNFSEFVASGFNIPGDWALMYACRTFAFALPVFIVGYLCLKNREVAQ